MALGDPHQIRKKLLRQETTAALKNTAWQIGMVVLVERHRIRMTQEQLATRAGVDRLMISAIENGHSVSRRTSDDDIDKLFATLKIGDTTSEFRRQIEFVKYWRQMDVKK
ncbi:helix-turn-helix domain-containing protein [Cellulosimicrobium cellulans]|uniref:helix-turn-helix domain-containing protein n=1 Tax=Cellulosimicrobium cellulans TaxID=1710 RepID=UPI0037F40854